MGMVNLIPEAARSIAITDLFDVGLDYPVGRLEVRERR